MRYCRHCGKPVEDGVKVCPNCFGSLEEPVAQQPSYTQSEAQKQSALVNSEGKAKGGFLVLAFLWFILGIVFAVMTNSAGYKQASKSYTIATVLSVVLSVVMSVVYYMITFRVF